MKEISEDSSSISYGKDSPPMQCYEYLWNEEGEEEQEKTLEGRFLEELVSRDSIVFIKAIEQLKSKEGSMRAQAELEEATEVDQVMDGLIPIFEELSEDEYAHFFLKQLVEKVSEDKLVSLFQKVLS